MDIPLSALPPALLLMGPTASGKTSLALELARELPVEIVSVDSAQVYRDMDIGTAKPSAAERSEVPHHLIDLIPPNESYSAARFRADASRVMEEIAARGRLPVLVGGTMLYFKSLREGLSELPEADAHVRARIEAEAAERGWPAMHAQLAAVDPVTADRLNRNDAQRIQRALEVFRLTGKPMSGFTGRNRAKPRFHILGIALVPGDRAKLHRRIEERFAAMLRVGLVDELAALRSRYPLTPDLPSMRSVGYRQAWQYLEGAFDREGLLAQGIYATRQLAKRQLTWIRSTPDVSVLDCFDAELRRKTLDLVHRALG